MRKTEERLRIRKREKKRAWMLFEEEKRSSGVGSGLIKTKKRKEEGVLDH